MNDPKTLDRLSARPADSMGLRAWRKVSSVFSNDEVPDRVIAARRNAQATITTGRRIAFVGLHGGAGTTSTMLAVAQSLAEARGGSVAAGAMWNSPDLHWRHDSEANDSGVQVHPDNLSDHLEHIPDLSRSQQLFLFDCGGSTVHLRAIAPHVTVLVARRTVRGKHLLDLVRDTWKHPMPTVAALRNVPDSGLSRTEEGVRLGDIAVIPHDRHLAGEARVSLGLVSEATRTAIDELGGLIVRTAVSQ